MASEAAGEGEKSDGGVSAINVVYNLDAEAAETTKNGSWMGFSGQRRR